MNEVMDKVKQDFTIEEIFPGELGDNLRRLNVKRPEKSIKDRLDAIHDFTYMIKSMLSDLDTEIMRLEDALEAKGVL